MKDLLKLIEGWEYGLWAAGLGMAFCYVVAKGSSHLSDDNKSRLSLYLQGDTIGTWAENFCALFDSIFGNKHFSLKTFLRSAIASVLAVGVLYVLLGPILGHLGTRSGETIPWLQVLAIGVAINILPDYLSLWETRWMLQLFRKIRNPLVQICVLILDLLISGAIIWGGVTAYRLIVGQPPIPLIEMAAVYSPYAIFFYSTFLTSLLAWIYWITSAFVKGFTGLGLNRLLNVSDARAGTTLGVTGGLAVFLLSLGAQPFAKMDDGKLDAQLCEWFPGVACVHGARLSADDRRKLDYLTKACKAGWTDCADEAFSRYDVNETEAARLWEAACAAGSAESCTNLGILSRSGIGVYGYDPSAHQLFRKGCEGGDARGCVNLAFMLDNVFYEKTDQVEIIRLLKKGCSENEASGCSFLGLKYESGFRVPLDYSIAYDWYVEGCAKGSGIGCFKLGSFYESGTGVPKDLVKALEAFEQSCDMSYEQGCMKLKDFEEVPK